MFEDETAVDQSEANATETVETAPQDTTVTEGTVTNDDNTQTNQQGEQKAPDAKDDFLGEVPKELEPLKKDILNKYYAKTRELATQRHEVEKVQKDAQTLQELMNYTPFKKWYDAEKNGGNATQEQSTLSETELDELRNDPTKFDSFMTRKVEALMESKYGGQMKSAKDTAVELARSRDVAASVELYGEDFTIAHKSGDLDGFYKAGFDCETAFAKYQLKNGRKSTTENTDREVQERATQMVNKSKHGSTEKPSSAGGKLPNIRIVKVRNFDEAFDAQFEAAKKGEKIKTVKGG